MRDKIFNDIITSMKSGEKDKVTVLRMLKSAIIEAEREKKLNVDDGEIIQIISKQIKTRKESIEQFKKGNRLDLVDKTSAEIKILENYLPPQLSEEELNDIVHEVFQKVDPTSPRDIGRIMQELLPKVKGRADMALVNQKIKEKLGS